MLAGAWLHPDHPCAHHTTPCWCPCNAGLLGVPRLFRQLVLLRAGALMRYVTCLATVAHRLCAKALQRGSRGAKHSRSAAPPRCILWLSSPPARPSPPPCPSPSLLETLMHCVVIMPAAGGHLSARGPRPPGLPGWHPHQAACAPNGECRPCRALGGTVLWHIGSRGGIIHLFLWAAATGRLCLPWMLLTM